MIMVKNLQNIKKYLKNYSQISFLLTLILLGKEA
jgi:hypothetical protein